MTTLKTVLLSDLHCEIDGELPDLSVLTELIVLAGDIDKGVRSIEAARHYQQQYRCPVILVAGNHEYYGSDYHTTLGALRQQAAATEAVHFLENDTVVIGDIRFLGCTLWTNFNLYGSKQRKTLMARADWGINDFRRIGWKGRAFQAADASRLCNASFKWLSTELAKPFDGKTVVVTHFAPHRAAINPKVGEGDELTPYFIPDCTSLFYQHRIDAWLYGHTHASIDTVVANGTRLVSNQGGYPGENPKWVKFDELKSIELQGKPVGLARLAVSHLAHAARQTASGKCTVTL